MGVIDSFEVASPEGQQGAGATAVSPSPQSSPSILLQESQATWDGAVTWAHGVCFLSGGAGELGRAQEA